MRCKNHNEVEAIALCRVCSLALCDKCAIPSTKGYVCSRECQEHATTIDRLIELQKTNLEAGAFRKWFSVIAFLLVLGGLLVGEHALFGTPASTPKVLFGILSIFAGLSSAIYLIFVKARSGT
jgi:hypothetical protein